MCKAVARKRRPQVKLQLCSQPEAQARARTDQKQAQAGRNDAVREGHLNVGDLNKKTRALGSGLRAGTRTRTRAGHGLAWKMVTNSLCFACVKLVLECSHEEANKVHVHAQSVRSSR